MQDNQNEKRSLQGIDFKNDLYKDSTAKFYESTTKK